jgi:hypothetical protein
MIPYELIIPSASRPHLLKRVLESLLIKVDQLPERILVHNDERFPDRLEAIQSVLLLTEKMGIPAWLENHNPPIQHGPALHRLLSQVKTEYVMYSQDDHQVKRDIPVSWALELLDQHGLNQIRFNKRDTLDKKGREGEEFYKVESRWDIAYGDGAGLSFTLCAADHWYFQTGVWRVGAIKPVIDWWAGPGSAFGAFNEHMEVKVNQVFNGQWREVTPEFPRVVPILHDSSRWNLPEVRKLIHKTFIWGKIGEPAYVEHIGHLPEDWALERANRDPLTRQV